jgi:acid phosphatase (class A)
MRMLLPLVLALAGALPAQTPAPAMAPAATPLAPPHFTQASAFDFGKLLPPPPAPDSIASRGELEVLLQVQAARTPEQVAWAKIVDTETVFGLADVLGPWFRKEDLPATEAFFKDFTDDVRMMDRAAKAPFLRPRPHTVDPAVQPCVRLPTSTSYPSGTVLQAYAWAELFAEIFPEKRDALFARARRAAWGRVLGGVHYPSDLAAGRLLVAPFLTECRKSEAFRAGWEKCRQELLAQAGKR